MEGERVASRTSDSSTPLFVAEMSSNHNRDLHRALALVDAAAEVGCDAVKFQLFRIDQLFAPEVLSRSEEHRARVEWELPLEFLPELAERAHARGMQFSCTPFYLEAVGQLLAFVDFYKVASYELLWDDLLHSCASSGKPVVLSTGMATLEEVAHAVDVMSQAGVKETTLLHCVSSYPTPAEECNLAAIDTLRCEFGCRVGWSDHSLDPAVVLRAVHRWGADMVELHFDLDESGAEYATGHCWLPDDVRRLVDTVRSGLVADGDGTKGPAEHEAREREWRADPADGLRPLGHMRSRF